MNLHVFSAGDSEIARMVAFRDRLRSSDADRDRYAAVKQQLALHSTGPPPRANIAGLMNLSGGVAFRVVSDELETIHEAIADHFHGMLCAPDAAGC